MEFTKERLLKIQSWSETYGPGSNVVLPAEEAEELARIALASLEAKPIGAFHISDQQVGGTTDYIKDGEWPIDDGVIEVYAAPSAPVSVPDYPETLPCPVMLDPGLRFGKGVPTKTMLGALLRRAEYHAELEAMTPEQRAEHDAGMKEFAAMLQGADGNSPVIKDGWVLVPIEPTLEMIKSGANAASDGMLIPGMYRAMLAAAPQQEE